MADLLLVFVALYIYIQKESKRVVITDRKKKGEQDTGVLVFGS
jgi:hypothetical protein